jgi:hypothetical protein
MTMTEANRTVTYVVVAVVSLALAIWLGPETSMKPKESKAESIGELFYPDFKTATDATYLRVALFDKDRAEVKTFVVENKDGKWIIPSHHNYQADVADRLANTATSMLEIRRADARPGSGTKESHIEFGVVDPLEESDTLDGRGQRLTLKKADDTLCDYIVGKQVKGRLEFYYVRRPDEKVTYVAKLNINLSTKFSDWIETDLLKFDREDLISLVFDKYAVDEQLLRTGRIKLQGHETTQLTKEKSVDPKAAPGMPAAPASTWKLDDLDAETEEFNVEKINTAVSTLDELKLMGVRPKSPELRDFLLGKSEDFNAREMLAKGFLPTANKLYSNQGEVIASTSKGVVYELKFGLSFAGSEFELESGLEKDAKKDKSDEADKKAGGDDSKDEKPDDEMPSDEKSGKKSGRYLFVMVHFDEKLLGPKPEKPEEPDVVTEEKTDDKKPAEEKKEAKDEDKKDETKKEKDEAKCQEDKKDDQDKPTADTPKKKTDDSDKPKSDDKPDDANADEKKSEPKPDPKKEYEAKLKKYEADLKAYEAKVKAGKDEVAKLNRKFADWYYVIPADSFDKLRLARKDIVKEKAKPIETKPDETKPDMDKPSNDKPEADKPADSKDKKPASAKPEEKSDDRPDVKPSEKKAAAKDDE